MYVLQGIIISCPAKPGPFNAPNKRHKTGGHRSKGQIDGRLKVAVELRDCRQGKFAMGQNDAHFEVHSQRTGVTVDKKRSFEEQCHSDFQNLRDDQDC
ncbi:hypothetical protein QR680_001123 [Steinernema hermaphroditum]|uniref:Uncharacterized protein n=1 Tax=Steinernema hermaphroditum TaxID=289476 RepID=A0AA39GYL3_9BILA|nr:hypothetical protein QR680_001123 [Steinernema hermaphroditum]